MMGTILGDMFDFNNAREELFFGQRSNFQGALYKQVTQGGVITQMREQGVPVDSAAGL